LKKIVFGGSVDHDVTKNVTVLTYVLLYIPSSAMKWMDPGPIRGRQLEANDEKYPKQGE